MVEAVRWIEGENFVAAGDGPAVVFSHGTMMDKSMFGPQIDGLSTRPPVIAFDQQARTERWQPRYDLHDLVEDCYSLLRQLELERCVLGGMSMGAFMALEFALAHPDSVAASISSMAQLARVQRRAPRAHRRGAASSTSMDHSRAGGQSAPRVQASAHAAGPT